MAKHRRPSPRPSRPDIARTVYLAVKTLLALTGGDWSDQF